MSAQLHDLTNLGPISHSHNLRTVAWLKGVGDPGTSPRAA